MAAAYVLRAPVPDKSLGEIDLASPCAVVARTSTVLLYRFSKAYLTISDRWRTLMKPLIHDAPREVDQGAETVST
jgi:hypothetical protein